MQKSDHRQKNPRTSAKRGAGGREFNLFYNSIVDDG